MWKTQEEKESKNVGLEKESKSVGLEKKDAMNQARWRVGVGELAVRVGYVNPATGLILNHNMSCYSPTYQQVYNPYQNQRT